MRTVLSKKKLKQICFGFSIFVSIFAAAMKYIGNILTESKLEEVKLFNVVQSVNGLIKDLPTLVIGWEKYAKDWKGISILERQIDKQTYWTFGKRERRNQMEKDLQWFKKFTLNNLCKTVKYRFLNVLTADKSEKARFFEVLKSSTSKSVYLANDMAYLFFEGTNEVIGISLRDIDYGGGDSKKLLSMIYSNTSVKRVETVPFDIKASLKNSLYIIPYLYS